MPEYTADSRDLTLLPFWQWDTAVAEQPPTREASVGLTLDSLLPHREVPEAMPRPSMFRHHQLQVEHGAAMPRNAGGEPVWVFGALVLLSGLLCLYYRIRKVKLLLLLKSTVDGRALDRLVRDSNLNRDVVMVSMGLLLMAAVALPAVRLLWPGADWWAYVAAAAGLGLLYVLRNGLMRFLGNVFERRQEVSRYITCNYVYHLVEATVAVPLLYFHFYLPSGGMPVLVALAVMAGVAFVMRLVQGVKIFLTHANGVGFYLFYYLCIVELVPVVVLLRVLIAQ